MLASHLGMTLERCRAETLSRNFPRWLQWLKQQKEQELEEERHKFEKQREKYEWYLARIALELVSANLKKGSPRPKLEKFLFKFIVSEDTPQTKQQKAEMQKAFWLASLGVKPDG